MRNIAICLVVVLGMGAGCIADSSDSDPTTDDPATEEVTQDVVVNAPHRLTVTFGSAGFRSPALVGHPDTYILVNGAYVNSLTEDNLEASGQFRFYGSLYWSCGDRGARYQGFGFYNTPTVLAPGGFATVNFGCLTRAGATLDIYYW